MGMLSGNSPSLFFGFMGNFFGFSGTYRFTFLKLYGFMGILFRSISRFMGCAFTL